MQQGGAAGNEAISTFEKLSIPAVNITNPGYMYIFASNESEDTQVWYDDMKVTYQRNNVVAGADYYPFGLVMSTREITQEPWRFGYQGQYAEKDKETGYNAFELRMYDARIARWVSPDPYGQFNSPYVAMGNNPVMGTDPTGGFCPECRWEIAEGVHTASASAFEAGPSMSRAFDGSIMSFENGVWSHAFSEITVTGSHLDLGAFSHAGLGAMNAASRLSGGLAVEFNIAYESEGELIPIRHFPTPDIVGVNDDFIADKLSQMGPRPLATGAVEPSMIDPVDILGPVAVKAVIGGAKMLASMTFATMTRLQATRSVGMVAHENFYKLLRAKGWQANTRKWYQGRLLGPDGISPSGKFFLELKPNTASGIAKGKWQIKIYKKFTGMHGRVVYYNPANGQLLLPFK